jgi:cytochrome d ubiquinol oxidase subunit I
LRTSEAFSKAVRSEQVLVSIVMFAVIYTLLFLVWVTVLNRKIKTGPEDEYSEVDPARQTTSWIDAVTGDASMTGAAGSSPGGEES